MEAHKSERIGGAPKRSRFDATYPVVFLCLAVLGGLAVFGSTTDSLRDAFERLGLIGREDFKPLYARLGVPPLYVGIETAASVHAGLEKVAREPCDSKAIFQLTEAVAKAGEERWAATALVAWSKACGAGTEGDCERRLRST